MPESPFDTIQAALEKDGPGAALDRLAEILRASRKLPQLFEALLMKKRHQLGLPLQGGDVFRELPEEAQADVESYYVEVCRTVGGLFLEGGDIPGAWPYFRAIDEPRKVAEAIDGWHPPGSGEQAEGAGASYEAQASAIDTIVDIALHQGANPRRGYELVLSHYGVCRAITVIEHQFPYAGTVKEECVRMLVERLHRDLAESLRRDIEGREGSSPIAPGETPDVRKLIENRPWLFESLGYHVDVSHLQAVVRAAACTRDRRIHELGLEMCEYGRRLPRDFQTGDRPPFDDFYSDYRIFLQALLGIGADGAMRYFTQKADRFSMDEDGKHFPGEILVYLLYSLGRYPEAIAAHLKYLRGCREPFSAAPSLFELCDRAGDFSKLLETAREKDDLLGYTAGIVRSAGERAPD